MPIADRTASVEYVGDGGRPERMGVRRVRGRMVVTLERLDCRPPLVMERFALTDQQFTALMACTISMMFPPVG